jgi:hypothetical protein
MDGQPKARPESAARGVVADQPLGAAANKGKETLL